MKLGLSLGYWGAGPRPEVTELVDAAERLGLDSMWAAEAYGSDALTPLAWLGARTSRLRLGTSIVQMSARTPVATAMAAMTLDHLSGGRFVLGIGASGPQVVEGWYGQPYPKPLARTREYVAILRQAMSRSVVSFDGAHFQLPYQGGTGLGKALRSTIHPLRPEMPILLAAEGPGNVALAAEIADGWIAMFYSPYNDAYYRAALTEGFARPGARRTLKDFEVVCPVSVEIADDVEEAADRVRPKLALYVGGMGARGANFHYEVFSRMGVADVCEKVQALYLGGRKEAAAAAIPLAMVEAVALVGPKEKIAAEFVAWCSSLVTTMVVAADIETITYLASLTD
jgi:F420-dependent oxidoreductase-like protein